MEKGALLLASYGTTRDSACSRGLDVLERELAEAFPQCELVTAFTSQKVRRALEARGARVASVWEACAALADDGFDDIIVLPALVTFGGSHDAVVRACAPFTQARIAAPLLADERDARKLAEVLSERHPRI
ncbi:MAG: sirohydrochlorin cobaltochelatase, partial [Atopobiaceae bacterium]|nr:sirohydrochlorin cobaltochelatase [Atopobiaceae bacterium]